MRNTEEIRNRALRNRPTEEDTKEVLEIIRKRAEEDVNSNVHFDEALLRRASVTRRPNEPLPSIRVDQSSPKRRSCPADLDNEDTETIPRYRWRSLSDTPLLELRNRSTGDRVAVSLVRSDTSRKERRSTRLSTNLPPLESELRHHQLERPNCVPSVHRNSIVLLPKEATTINMNYENEDLSTENVFFNQEDCI